MPILHSKTLLNNTLNAVTPLKVILALLLLSKISVVQADATPFQWPNGTTAAISLQYDDAVDSQLDNVVPELNKLGLRATFAVSLGSLSFHRRTTEWISLPKQGHELANHTLFHQCIKTPQQSWLEEWQNLSTIAAEQMRDEIFLANTVLASYDQQAERTFTIPCGDRIAKNKKDYVPLIQHHFLGIKTMGGDPARSMKNFDRMDVHSLVPHNATAKQLIAYVEKAKQHGTMASIIFHGIGGDHLAVAKKEHDAFIQYLANHQDVYWVESFANIMRHVKAQEALSAQSTKGKE
ncbi:hypothetical protein TDB9533_03425 [Thalassocella blandensis]|nr:hypothetical protein TDB9533_03425 [Thalassocella blandensis]